MKLTSKTAQKYFRHEELHRETETQCCFFSARNTAPDHAGNTGDWGFWVRPCGTVDVDVTLAEGGSGSNGKLPSRRIVNACVRAAVAYLR